MLLIFVFILGFPCLNDAWRGGRVLSVDGILNTGTVLGEQAFDLMFESVGLEERCPYIQDMGRVLRDRLPSVIVGQPTAVAMISDAVAAWEYRKVYMGSSSPLVLALAGDTGTGKSETALRLSETLLQKRDRLSITDYRVSSPRGFMVLRGEEYSPATYSGRDGAARVQRLLSERIAAHLESCGGNGVILLDEVQKFVNGSIELFLSGLSDQMGDMASHHWLTGAPTRVSTRNLVVLLATDIGREQLQKLLLEHGGDASAIPQQQVRTALSKRFDAHWPGKLFSAAVAENVPFFPLDQAAIKDILRLHLKEMALKEMERGSMVDFVYDSLLINYMTSHKYVHYLKYSNPDSGASIIAAEKGGRSISKKGPLLTLQALIVRYMQPWQGDRILHVGVEPSTDVEGVANDARLRLLGAPGADEKGRPFLYLQWCRVTPRQESEMSYARSKVNAQRQEATTSSTVDAEGNSDSTGDEPGGDGRAVALEGVVNTRVGQIYFLSEGEVFSPNACETKWIGHLESSLRK